MNVVVRRALDAAEDAAVQSLLARCEKADGHSPFAETQKMAVARADLGGDGTVALLGYDGDLLSGCAILTPAGDGAMSLHVAVDPDRRGGTRVALVQAALDAAEGDVHLWCMQATAADDAEVAGIGFRPERDVIQMRVPLPLPEDVVAATKPLPTRSFDPDRDAEVWLSVNNRAFAGHPEQGGWTMDQLRARMRAPWFDPDGFRVADDPDGDGLIGSCWTKVHRAAEPVLGEIYVISVDPNHHGEGWGRSLTVAGLEWLAAQRIRLGMLYTDSTNGSAVGLYGALGFTVHHTDRCYTRSERE